MHADASSVLTRIRRIIGLQVKVTVVISLLLLALYGAVVALSGLLGGAVSVIGSWAYAISIAAPRGDDPKLLLRGHYRGELFKLAATVASFALVFIFFDSVRALPLFLTYVATLSMYWVALIVDN